MDGPLDRIRKPRKMEAKLWGTKRKQKVSIRGDDILQEPKNKGKTIFLALFLFLLLQKYLMMLC